jgi:hypothetical protein
MNHLLTEQYNDEDDELAYQMTIEDDDHDEQFVYWRRRRIVASLLLHYLRRHWHRAQELHGRPRRKRVYLRRAELLPSPRLTSAWQSIYQSREDRAYIQVLGINVATFDYLLASGFEHAWNTRAITWTDTDPPVPRRTLSLVGSRGQGD